MAEQIPDGLVCLTFDDSVKSQHTVAAPLLEELGFGATFYISEHFLENEDRYMTWPEVADLDARGFEIGNHTRHHADVTTQCEEDLLADIVYIDDRCVAHGIAKPTTFCYPGYPPFGRSGGNRCSAWLCPCAPRHRSRTPLSP